MDRSVEKSTHTYIIIILRFLLFSAAFCMGGVAIWSMHFIGNNCLTLTIPGDEGTYQLAYAPGFTFVSLVVSIICTFFAFAFVGVTEEAKLIRIVPSGVLAGVSYYFL